MATKVYDIAVKTGEYQKDGQTKGRYKNIGVVMKGDDGSFIILDRTSCVNSRHSGISFTDTTNTEGFGRLLTILVTQDGMGFAPQIILTGINEQHLSLALFRFVVIEQEQAPR